MYKYFYFMYTNNKKDDFVTMHFIAYNNKAFLYDKLEIRYYIFYKIDFGKKRRRFCYSNSIGKKYECYCKII